MAHTSEHELGHDIVMTDSLWYTLRSHLLRPPEHCWLRWSSTNEQLAFILASGNLNMQRWRLLARELLLAGPSDLLRQSAAGIAPRPEFVMAALNRCQSEGLHLIEVHSHPFARGAGTTFSAIDWHNDLEKMPSLALFVENFIHATMVVGQDSLDAHFYDRATRQILPMRQVVIVGLHEQRGSGLRYIPTTSGGGSKQATATDTNKRYHRQELVFGHETQQRFRNAIVAVVGLGGLGSFVAIELAHLGIGHLILIDPDHVEETNLNRLLGAEPADVGRAKVAVYTRLIEHIAPTTQVKALPFSVMDEVALSHAKGADILVGCVDSHGARLVLNQLAIRYLIPLVDGGSGIKQTTEDTPLKAGGQVQVVLPGIGCLECRGFIDPRRAAFDLAPAERQAEERTHGYGLDQPAPAVIFLNGVIGSAQVAEVVFLLSGSGAKIPRPVPPIGLYDAFDRSMLAVEPHTYSGCITCGEGGVLGIGDLAPIRPAGAAGPGSSIPVLQRVEDTSEEAMVPETVPQSEPVDIERG